ncbi:MAG: DUF1223 domain-containing protein [Kofleriaceae bacterium]
MQTVSLPRLGVLLALGLSRACTSVGEAPVTPATESRAKAQRAATVGASEAPVLVELFTSQGCSSCPPAERVVAELAQSHTLGGRPVVALAYHVDVWDDLGWADPLARPEFTERHERYAARLSDRRWYTPQAIIAGSAHRIGSRRADLTEAVLAVPPVAPLAVEVARSSSALEVVATAPADAAVWLAVWEDGVATTITRGENAGSEVVSEHVVRRLVKIAAAGARGRATVELDPSWRQLGAVAFAQAGAGAIAAVSVLDLPSS